MVAGSLSASRASSILIHHLCKEVKELAWSDDGMNNTHTVTDCREVP